jgi:NAD(P)-dependent dehydrogenase (short-subunit alcohol dehydrogenase family)
MTKPGKPFSGRAVLVTGGSAGIGKALALGFADAGAEVLITGRRVEPLQEVAAEDPAIHPITADVADVEAPERVLSVAEGLFGGLDVLVNNAGAFSAHSLIETDTEKMRHLFETNVFGPTRFFLASLPLLMERQGTVVNISSTLGSRPAPGAVVYGASKAALEHLTRSWALAVAKDGVRVNAIAPGPTDTDILHSSGLSSREVDEIQKKEAQSIPLGRRGTPKEVARWVLSLADPEATWVTGQILGVDGGMAVA